MEQCLNYLMEEARFGEMYEIGRDTLLCCMMHGTMLAYRPEAHCEHIGPGGGGMCSDNFGYEEMVEKRYFSNSGWGIRAWRECRLR
jgi:hypothetical protein